MQPPELPTPAEEKAIAEMIETDIDHAIEVKHVHEVEQPNDALVDEGY